MPIIAPEPDRYEAREPFETTVDFTGSEFKALGNGNGLPREALVKRSFVMLDDTKVQIEGINVFLEKGRILRDVTQAQAVIKQKPDNIIVRDRLRFEAGQELPPGVGEALAQAGNRYPVRLISSINPFALSDEDKAEIDAQREADEKAAKEAAEKAAGPVGSPPSKAAQKAAKEAAEKAATEAAKEAQS